MKIRPLVVAVDRQSDGDLDAAAPAALQLNRIRFVVASHPPMDDVAKALDLDA